MTVFQDNIPLPLDIYDLFRKNPSGEVLLSTSKGLYLQLSDRIILVTDSQYGLTPIGIGIPFFVDFMKAVDPREGQPVKVTCDGIAFDGGTLSCQWSTAEPVNALYSISKDRISQCAELLVRKCNSRSAALLAEALLLSRNLSAQALENKTCCRALPLLQKLIEVHSDKSVVACIVNNLLGLGNGLTPSMDDVLLGLLYGLQRLPCKSSIKADLSDAILIQAQTSTNAISAAYLVSVARGAYFERLEDALRNLSTDEPLNIDPMLEIGSSSGSEMLFGLLLAAQITSER